jgi:uncharacterized membrane protein
MVVVAARLEDGRACRRVPATPVSVKRRPARRHRRMPAMKPDTIAALARQLLDLDEGELRPREKAVIERAAKRLAVSRNINLDYESEATFGQRLADRVAAVGGSWGFLIGFGIAMAIWIALNTVILATEVFDPYPFVFLNLMLSLLAAVQAPVILMAQNRQAIRDRLAAAHDYEVNLKAEIEIAALHDKLDQIRTNELATLIERVESAVVRKA